MGLTMKEKQTVTRKSGLPCKRTEKSKGSIVDTSVDDLTG